MEPRSTNAQGLVGVPVCAMSFLREHPELVKDGLVARNRDPEEVDRLLALDARWKEIDQRINRLRAQRNSAARRGADRPTAAEGASDDTFAALREEIRELEGEARRLEAERAHALLLLPVAPHTSVPRGTTAADNVVLAERRARPEPTFALRTHDDIGHALNLLDEERGAKVAGEGFFVLWGDLARLEHALIRYMRELHAAREFVEVVPPILINSQSMIGTGQLPKFAEDSYQVKLDDLWLAPTAEVPVTNLFRDEILLPDDLPLKLMAYTPCFRREAGGHGVETRGIARVHQFDKVELVVFSTPEDSYAQLEALREEAELVLQGLELPYRIVSLCTGDLPDKAAKCYDLELWAPGSRRWLEVSSISNFEAFQSSRANIRWRRSQGVKAEPLHTLNASGVALPRLVVSLMENYQTAEGEIEIPKVLRPLMADQRTLRANPFLGERELARGRHPKRPSPRNE
ncbi:MAG: serine--tRNA ligase [Thermoplasmata archaeon]